MLAYHKAFHHKGQPTVILAKTVKGYGLGEAGEGKNISHQQKKMNEKELREFRDRLNVPINDEEIVETPFFRPESNSDAAKYLLNCRENLKGFYLNVKNKFSPYHYQAIYKNIWLVQMVVNYQPPWHLFVI